MATMIFIEECSRSSYLVAEGVEVGSDRAANCAISSSCGAPAPLDASASRNIVLQNGQAVPTVLAPVSSQLRRPHMAHTFTALLAQKG